MDFELSAGILAAGPAQPAYSLDLAAWAYARRRMARGPDRSGRRSRPVVSKTATRQLHSDAVAFLLAGAAMPSARAFGSLTQPQSLRAPGKGLRPGLASHCGPSACLLDRATSRRDWRNDRSDGCPERVRSSLQALTDLG